MPQQGTNDTEEGLLASRKRTVVTPSNRKPRTHFTQAMDLHLIKATVQHNPYQLGSDQWVLVKEGMKEAFNDTFLLRTLKLRVEKLLEKYSKEQLEYKTGTEEVTSELSSLLETLFGYVETSKMPINAEVEEIILGDHSNIIFTEEEVVETASRVQSSASRKAEKRLADAERDEFLLSGSDRAPGPITERKRRGCLAVEDQMIKRKQEHDMEMDNKRVTMEQLKQDREYEIEKRRLDLEEKKINVQESQLRMQESQLKIQETMCTLITKLAENK